MEYNDTFEWCSNCEEEFIVNKFKIYICPGCGEKVYPCSLCDMDKVVCGKDCPTK